MTKRLILMRHAKSGWDDPLLQDIERPLNERGQTAARAMGAWLTAKGYLPTEAISSSATRTRETFDQLGLDAPVSFHPELYLASAGRMFEALKGCTGDVVLMIGHNPGIAELAEGLVANAPEHGRFFDYPTCATLVCDFPVTTWADAVSRSAQVVDFVVPKDLID